MQQPHPCDRTTALPDRAGHFRRPRVEALFSAASLYPLVLVTAGAGWGKTQAASAFLNADAPRFLFVCLSGQDNLTARFWQTLQTAALPRFPALAAELATLPFPDSPALFHLFLTLLSNAVGTQGRLILVFDDIHIISKPEVLQFFDRLIAARQENICLMLMGRTLPPLDLPHPYQGGAAFRITEEDLQFTEGETEDYLRAQTPVLEPGLAATVQRQTEGWIAAIYLIGLAFCRHGTDRALALAKRQIFELIEQEIFAQYPPEVQRALIKFALFAQLPADVFHAHPALLGGLADDNRFLRFNPAAGTYELHNLFREFLLEKQVRLTEGERREAHLKVADWHRAHGSALDALEHYQISGQYEAIWEIIRGYDVRMPTDLADFFLRLLDQFPRELSSALPLFPVVRARLQLNNGQVAESEAVFTQLVQTHEAMPPTPETLAVIGESCLFLAFISMLSFDERYIDYFKKAEACLPRGSSLIDKRLCFSEGNYMLLVRDPEPGSLDRHVMGVLDAMPYATRAMNGAGYGVKYVTLAEAAYYTCDVKTAERYAYKAIYQAEQNAQYDTICAAYFVLLRVYLYSGHFPNAAACITELNEKLANAQGEAQARGFTCTRDIMTGWYYARLGDLDKVPDWILKKEKRDKVLLPNSLGRDPLIRAACLLVNGRDCQLAAYLDVLEGYYDERGLLPARLEVQIYKAVAAHRLGQLDQSMDALKKAYDLAAGNGLFMPFIELGKYMRAVLYAARQLETPPIPAERLEEIYTKASTYEKRMRSARTQYEQDGAELAGRRGLLTRREREILRHLCQGLTSDEIAGNLYVSTSTVKKALISIYNKLGAVNRADAVRIALQSGL